MSRREEGKKTNEAPSSVLCVHCMCAVLFLSTSFFPFSRSSSQFFHSFNFLSLSLDRCVELVICVCVCVCVGLFTFASSLPSVSPKP
jgi:hypothetical protein